MENIKIKNLSLDTTIKTNVNNTDDNIICFSKKINDQKRYFIKRLKFKLNQLSKKSNNYCVLLNRNFNFYKIDYLTDIKKLSLKSNPINDEKANQANDCNKIKVNNVLIKKLLGKNIESRKSFKPLPKLIQLKKDIIKKDDAAFMIKKREFFKKEMSDISKFDHFNYKGSNSHRNRTINIKDLDKKETKYFNDTNSSQFPTLKSIINRKKSNLINGLEEKKSELSSIIFSGNNISKDINNLNSLEDSKDVETTQLENDNYLKKIIKNNMKNKGLIGLNNYNTLIQNQKIRMVSLKLKFKKKNKSINEEYKGIKINNDFFLRNINKKFSRISKRIHSISNNLHKINQNMNGCLNSVRNIIHKDIKFLSENQDK